MMKKSVFVGQITLLDWDMKLTNLKVWGWVDFERFGLRKLGALKKKRPHFHFSFSHINFGTENII